MLHIIWIFTCRIV